MLLACPSPSLRCVGAEEGAWKVLPSAGHLGEHPGVGAGQRTCPERRLRLSKLSSFGSADKNPIGSRAVVGFGLRNADYERNWRWRYKEEAASGSVKNPEK